MRGGGTRTVYARTTYSREGESYNPKRPTPIRADSEGPTRLFEGSLESKHQIWQKVQRGDP